MWKCLFGASLGLASEHHIKEKGYASVNTLLTSLILILCACDYCKKAYSQWKKHNAKNMLSTIQMRFSMEAVPWCWTNAIVLSTS